MAIVVDYGIDCGSVATFVCSAAALVPLAWLIGEATDHAALRTGPGIGGFLNATFGNTPELIIALFAVNNRLDDVVRGSLTGSVVGNLLLVLGFSLLVGPASAIDRSSALVSIGLVLGALLLMLVVAVPGWRGDASRHSLQLLSIPVAAFMLLAYIVVTWRQLRRHRARFRQTSDVEPGWSLRKALGVLAAATLLTAIVSEGLVGSIESFARQVHISDLFVAAVIVAVIGNAAEHGSAVVVAHRGRVDLATEIALSSSAQVAVLVVPAVVMVSFALQPLALAFSEVEVAVVAAAALLVAVVLVGGKARGWKGAVLIAAYALTAAAFYRTAS